MIQPAWSSSTRSSRCNLLIPRRSRPYVKEGEGDQTMYRFIGYAGVATASVVLWWALIKLSVDISAAF
jgi:hypothetical protein